MDKRNKIIAGVITAAIVFILLFIGMKTSDINKTKQELLLETQKELFEIQNSYSYIVGEQLKDTNNTIKVSQETIKELQERIVELQAKKICLEDNLLNSFSVDFEEKDCNEPSL